MLEYIGFIGLTLLVVAWVPETIKSLKSGRTAKMEFLVLYFVGSILLTIHAIIIRDLVFTILNGLASILSGINVGKAIAMRRSK